MPDSNVSVLEQAIHDWYTDRWNEAWADAKEPGWALSSDLAELLMDVLNTRSTNLHRSVVQAFKKRTKNS